MAGKTQAACSENVRTLPILCEGGVRYTVPETLRPDAMDDTVTLRFRVDNIYKNRSICVYFGDRRILQRKRPVLAPGEMEQVTLTKKQLAEYPDIDHITVTIEEG